MLMTHMWCGEKHLTVELNYPEIGDTVHVDFGRSYAIKHVYSDNEGKKYFIWDKTRMYLDYLKDYNMEMIQKKVENNEHVADFELILAILNDGVEKVRFIDSCYKRSTSDIFGLGIFTSDTDNVVCSVHEGRYKVIDGYKISLTPSIPNENYAGDHYYTSDLRSLIKSGSIRILTSEGVEGYFVDASTHEIHEVMILQEGQTCEIMSRKTGQVIVVPSNRVTTSIEDAERMAKREKNVFFRLKKAISL